MWNDLPEEIRNSSSKCSSKKHLKKHILSSLQILKTYARKVDALLLSRSLLIIEWGSPLFGSRSTGRFLL